MDGITNVILGMTAPETNAEGETVVIKNGKYDTALGLVVLECEMDGSDMKTKKTAGEILDLANNGAVLFCRLEVGDDDIATLPVLEYALSSGTYTMIGLSQAGSVATGTSTDKDDPIVFSGS